MTKYEQRFLYMVVFVFTHIRYMRFTDKVLEMMYTLSGREIALRLTRGQYRLIKELSDYASLTSSLLVV